jgi:hypothetical protein
MLTRVFVSSSWSEAVVVDMLLEEVTRAFSSGWPEATVVVDADSLE